MADQLRDRSDPQDEREGRWRVRRELMTVTPEQLMAFRDKLAPYRPSGELRLTDDACETFFDDMPGLHLTWLGQRTKDRLIFDFGCDSKKWSRMKDDLVSAPALLGVPMPEQSWVATTRIR